MAGMMTGLLLLLLVGVTVGRVVDLQKRIFGGQRCDDDKHEYHVKLIDGKGELVCGGSLINKDWILTAAHCVVPGTTVKAVLRVHPGGKKKTFEIETFQIYEKDTVKQDMALLKVKAPEEGYDYVKLPDCNKPPVLKEIVQIAGHGATGRKDANNDQYGDSKTLQCANIDVEKCPVNVCTSGYYADPNKVFCYKGVTRPGDSGGGVMFNGLIYGVHKQLCGGYGVALDVCDKDYKAWIEKVTKPITEVTKP